MGANHREHSWNGIGQSVDASRRPAEAQAEKAVTDAHAIIRWRAADNLVWTRYDDSDEWLVLNPASGDIHLLSDSAYRLWQLTNAEPALTSDELLAALRDASESPTQEFVSAVRASLAFMDRAGLIYPVMPA